MQEYVFRFLSVRPADTAAKVTQAPEKVSLYAGRSFDTPLLGELKNLGPGRAAEAARLVAAYRDSGQSVRDLASLPFDVRPGIDWVQLHPQLLPADPTVSAMLVSTYDAEPSALAHDPRLQESLGRLADTLLAETISPESGGARKDSLALAHKFLTFITELGTEAAFPPGATLAQIIGVRTLVAPGVGKTEPIRIGLSDSPPALAGPLPADGGGAGGPSLAEQLAQCEQAHRELSDLAQNTDFLTLFTVRPIGRTVGEPPTGPEQLSQTQAMMGPAAGALQAPAAGAAAGGAAQEPNAAGPGQILHPTRPVLTEAAIAGLSPATASVLAALRVNPATVAPATAVAAIERQISVLSSQVASTQANRTVLTLGGAMIDKGRLLASLGVMEGRPPIVLQSSFCSYQAGVGDLLMVRQTLKAYELAEFAHVENVLAGETRDREHRRLDTSEDITTTEQSTETQKETDLQSTQRNEMQTEADKTVKQQFGLEAGLQVSGSYGPAVQFAAHLNANFSTSSEETQRKSVAFSQEITEKTSESIKQSIKQTTSHRVLQEIQEINKHSFVNGGSKHIRGVYRWLNKVYDAQIYNYGQRMMYEFVIPEPAAYFLFAMIDNPPADLELVKPEPPTFNGAPLKPDNLTPGNYTELVARYQVAGVPAPNPEFQTAAYFDKQDGQTTNSFGRAEKIQIPDGYETVGAVVSPDYIFPDDGSKHDFHVMIGNRNFDVSGFWGCTYQDIDSYQHELSVSYHLMQVWDFNLGIDVTCRQTAEAKAKWQQSVYDSIIATYLKQKADYDEKVAAKKVNDTGVLGRNPLENQRIVSDELRKLVLMVLTGSDDIARDSYYPSSEPLMDLAKVCPNGSWIRFFENAFEWTNLVYVLYPYFWGRHARWISAIHFTDPDPDFAAFLRAGAVRVQVPVRPGFERAVAYFCQYGTVWEGNDPPLRDDDMYVPIVDEIAANLGKYTGDGIPYPAGSQPWEVRIPTELVLVENVDEVPGIVDALTGRPVTLHE